MYIASTHTQNKENTRVHPHPTVQQKLRDEVRILRRQAEGGPATEGLEGHPSSSECGGEIPILRPKFYNGKSFGAFNEYIRRCECAFLLGPDLYFKDSIKVTYAA